MLTREERLKREIEAAREQAVTVARKLGKHQFQAIGQAQLRESLKQFMEDPNINRLEFMVETLHRYHAGVTRKA